MNNDNSCPICERVDSVQSMPAIAATGTATVSGTSTYTGLGIGLSGGVVPVIGSARSTSAQTSMLAAATRPAPAPRSVTGPATCGILLLIAALIMFGIAVAAATHLQPSTAQATSPMRTLLVLGSFLTLPFALPALASFLVLRHRSRENARIARGLPAAQALWSSAFYCHRCGVCYWPRPLERGIDARRPFSPDEFQQIVWSAGGFGVS
ncbi:hypothetical protein [Nocardia sp. NBC_01388]|uniref:hypothetical protein n=1 Tax=Nocardia sp. NBC_01388 TaxID=2903596 RepID=UPI003253E43C